MVSGMEINNVIDAVLPDFSGQGVINVKLRRPSLLALAARGCIPNELLACARQLFNEGGGAPVPLDELGRLLIIFARESLVEPSFEQLEQQGVSLTDEQLSAIYAFAQAGVRALIPFRDKCENADPAVGGGVVRPDAE